LRVALIGEAFGVHPGGRGGFTVLREINRISSAGGLNDGEAGATQRANGADIAGGGFGAAGVSGDIGKAVIGGSGLRPNLAEMTAARVVGTDKGKVRGFCGGKLFTSECCSLLEFLFAAWLDECELGDSLFDRGPEGFNENRFVGAGGGVSCRCAEDEVASFYFEEKSPGEDSNPVIGNQ
jgi:hypothetical protein